MKNYPMCRSPEDCCPDSKPQRRVAVEAFAKGTPVIAASSGAVAELVDDRRTGLQFKAGDADSLACGDRALPF